jgi:hypothetical protein
MEAIIKENNTENKEHKKIYFILLMKRAIL